LTSSDRTAEASLPADRRERILVAAETCFGRSGFDRTTMQDIAREAAMSPANIYRYFDSKEALIVGLVDRDRERAILLSDSLRDGKDERAQLLSLIEHYFRGMSRDAAILRLSIWSESTRNPAIADLIAKGAEESRDWLTAILSRLAGSSDCDIPALHAALEVTLKGMVVSRAIQTDYDPAAMVTHFAAVMDAGLAWRPPGESRKSPKSVAGSSPKP
jgi:TetR/AcrR family transcriptional regulator, repressor for uid operon